MFLLPAEVPSNVGPTAVLRIGTTPGTAVLDVRYRVYFAQDGEQLVILLAGGTKRRQQEDIELARRLWSEYKKRKREER